MDPLDERADERLAPHVAAFRDDTLTRLHPPGALAARRAAEARRGRRILAAAGLAAVATLATAVGAYALTGRPDRPTLTTGTPGPSAVASAPAGPASGSASPATGPTSSDSGLRTPPAGAHPPAVDRCHTAGLSARFAGGSGFAGGGSRNLVLTNISGHVCRLYGNPGMLLLDAQGSALPTTVHWVGTRVLVTLQPGQSGYADVTTWVNPGPTDTGAPCDPPAAAVEVTPPDETTQLTITGSWQVCQHGYIEVGPMVASPANPMAGG